MRLFQVDPRALASWMAALALAGPGSRAVAQTNPPPADRLLPLEVNVNSAQGGSWTLLERNGLLYAPAEAFEEWRVNRRPNAQGVDYRGQTWYPLSAVQGFEARMNYADQSVSLVFSSSAFAATRLGNEAVERPPLSATEPALFLNYDLNLSHTASRLAPATSDLGALTELGLSTGLGVLTSSFVGRNLSNSSTGTPRSWRRLETVFTRDFPEHKLSLRLGDSSTRAGLWGRSVYFGGVQLGRNFALAPGFVSQPIPTISGTSSAPSTVELYINDALRQTSNVPAGPFAIDNFPLLTGAGQARVVVRDVLGRETVLTQAFFSHTHLLDEGLSDWSLEAGAVRRELGLESASYGQRFGSGLLRYGLSRELTAETRLEWGAETRNAGLGLSYGLPLQALGQAAVAWSQDDRTGRGQEWLLGLEHSSLRHGFSARIQGASRNYRQLGLETGTLPYRRQFSGSYAYTSEALGSLGLGLARIATYDRGTLTTYSANYSIRVGARNALTFSVTRVSGSSKGQSFGVSFTMPLDGNLTSSSNLTHKPGRTDGYTGVSKGLSNEVGLGWRALAGRRDGDAFSEGGLYYQGSRALLTADLSASSAQQSLRLGAQGGLVFMDRRFFVSRRVQDSFALVEVPGYPDVGVGFQGSTLTRTDANGLALLPRLLPYQRNSIRLDPNELPINAELDSIEQVAVPAARSGVKVVFPVRSGRGALIRIVLDDGEPAPAGAEITLQGDPKEFFVARRGEAFVTGLQTSNTLRLQWNGGACTFAITLPPGHLDEIARVGPVTCSGVHR